MVFCMICVTVHVVVHRAQIRGKRSDFLMVFCISTLKKMVVNLHTKWSSTHIVCKALPGISI